MIFGKVYFPASIAGHVGDGDFHVLCVLDFNNPAQFEEANRFAGQSVQRALATGATCAGEPRIGCGKMKYLNDEHGEALEVMWTIKQAL